MEITCPRCGSRYQLDVPASSRARPSKGMKFRCTHCTHSFNIDPAQTSAPAPKTSTEPPQAAHDAFATGSIGEPVRLVQQQGAIYEVPDMGTLYRWILEHRISRSDLCSVHGMRWQSLGDRADLERFFTAAELLVSPKEPSWSRSDWSNLDVVPMDTSLQKTDSADPTPSAPPSPQPVESPRSSFPPDSENALELESASEAIEPAEAGLTESMGLSLTARQSATTTELPEEPVSAVVLLPDSAQADYSGAVNPSVVIEPSLPEDIQPVQDVPEGLAAAMLATAAIGQFDPPELMDRHTEITSTYDPPSAVPMESGTSVELEKPQSLSFDESFPAPLPPNPEPTETQEASSEEAESAGAISPLEEAFLNQDFTDVPGIKPVNRKLPIFELRPPRKKEEEGLQPARESLPPTFSFPPLPPNAPPHNPLPSPEPLHRHDVFQDDPEEETKGIPPWVWGLASAAVIVIIGVVLYSYSTLNKPAASPTPTVAPVTVAPSTPSPAPITTPSPPATPEAATPKPAPTPAPTPKATATPKPAATPPPEATTPKPASVKTLMAQGWKAVDARRYDEAYSLFDKAVEARPGSPDALYGRAYASAKRGDKASARVDYCNALEKTTDPELRVELEAGLRQVGGSCN